MNGRPPRPPEDWTEEPEAPQGGDAGAPAGQQPGDDPKGPIGGPASQH